MLTTKSHVEYTREVKTLLPKEAFRASPKKLVYVVAYSVIILLCDYAFRLTHSMLAYAASSVVIAHCLSCIGFIAHEISHNTVIKNPTLRYPLEVYTWAVNLIPATLWDRVHNHTHHALANTPKDPDRQFFKSEKSTMTKWYTKVFYPNAKNVKWNPVVGFHFIPYIIRNIVSSFYKGDKKPTVVPAKPSFSGKRRRKIVFELAVILVLQVGIYFLTGANWKAYLFAGPLAYLLTSSILMAYIFTNHFTNPITEHADPLLGTTSVQVPGLLNALHFNFAYHTEHHLFPSMNSDYYPLLSKILVDKFPDRYNYRPISDVWKKLWNNDDFIDIPEKADR